MYIVGGVDWIFFSSLCERLRLHAHPRRRRRRRRRRKRRRRRHRRVQGKGRLRYHHPQLSRAVAFTRHCLHASSDQRRLTPCTHHHHVCEPRFFFFFFFFLRLGGRARHLPPRGNPPPLASLLRARPRVWSWPRRVSSLIYFASPVPTPHRTRRKQAKSAVIPNSKKGK